MHGKPLQGLPLVNDNYERFKRRARHEGGSAIIDRAGREEENADTSNEHGELFEFSNDDGRMAAEHEHRSVDSVRHTGSSAIMCPFAVPRTRPLIADGLRVRSSDGGTQPLPVDEAEEWISEYTAQQAYEEREKESNDPQKMAEAAADLLSQMDLAGDEKLRNCEFVAYLKQLASHDDKGKHGSDETLDDYQGSDFDFWKKNYEQSTYHLTGEEERAAWDAIAKDWQRMGAYGMGYESFAETHFRYEFANTPNGYEGNINGGSSEIKTEVSEEEANMLFENGHVREAIIAFEALVKHNPSDSSAWLRLGQLQIENEQDILAIAAFKRYLALDPTGNPTAWLEMAGALFNEQCRTEAMEALFNFLRNDPRHSHLVETNTTFVGVAEELGALIERALDDNPNDPNLHVALSIFCMVRGSGDTGEAIKSVQRAVDMSADVHGSISHIHDRSVLLNRLGALHANSGNLATALRIYDGIIEERPEMARVHYNRGVSLLNGADYAGAIRAFSRALRQQLIPARALSMREDIAEGLDHVWSMLRLACELLGNEELASAAKRKDRNAFEDYCRNE